MNEVKQNLQNEINKIKSQIEDNKALLQEADKDMQNLIEEENKKLKSQIEEIELSISHLEGDYTSEDEDIDGNGVNPNKAILEIRAGTGGDEAGLFAGDLYKMYLRYCEIKGFRAETRSISEGEHKAIKTVTVEIKGKDVYTLLQHESGVHRVQRVPATESQGRIHTSTATVAVLPVVSPITVEIRPEDINEEFYRAGGKGGQNVNKVSTAVRLTHIPTGIVVENQTERFQGKNREKAMETLRSRLYQMMLEKQVSSITDLRSDQVGSGERSEKIRTYNYPQDRITDHRVKKSWGNIAKVLNGDLDGILEATSVLSQSQ